MLELLGCVSLLSPGPMQIFPLVLWNCFARITSRLHVSNINFFLY